MIVATVADWVIASPVSFLAGLGVGFVLSDRYRITRRNGTEKRGPP